jgi:hypothetical protein
MTPESHHLECAWLAKAESDLATARLLIIGEEPYFDTGCYHCQQAADKAIKAWLTAVEALQNQIPPKKSTPQCEVWISTEN